MSDRKTTITNPRQHHYVPQGYQNGFANERKQVTVVDRRSGESYTSNTRNVFQQRDFYTLEDAAGEKLFEVENNLGDVIDGPSAVCFERLRNGNLALEPDERFLLCHFMSVQLVRGTQIREQLRSFTKDINDRIISLNATHLTPDGWKQKIGEVPTGEALRRMASDPASLGIQPSEGLLIQTLLANQNDVAEMLEKRTFTVVQFEQDSLFTGECPVVHINPSGRSTGFGVATAERMYLPVSPRVALVLSLPWAEWPEGSVIGTPELAKRLNWAMFAYPNNRKLLRHPDVDQYPIPGVSELTEDFHWPWGEDPASSPSSHLYSPDL